MLFALSLLSGFLLVASAAASPAGAAPSGCTSTSTSSCAATFTMTAGTWTTQGGTPPTDFPAATAPGLAATYDPSTGQISNGTLTIPEDPNVCSGGCINVTFFEATPGSATGSIDGQGNVSITDNLKVEVDITSPIQEQCISPTSFPVTFTSTTPYDPATGDVALAANDFTIPNFNGQPNCGEAAGGLNAYPGGFAGPGASLTLNWQGTVPLPPGAPTTTALSVSPSGGSTAGQAVTLTATVTSGTSAVTQGSVTFFNGTTSVGSGSLDGSGQATVATSALPAGTATLTAQYGGSPPNYGPSTSAPITYTVSPPAPLYVAAGGTDSGNCQDQANPCATITYALTQAVSGGTIVVSGTIAEDVTLGGSTGATVSPITITGADDATINPPGAGGPVFTIGAGVDVTLNNFWIRPDSNAPGQAVLDEGGDVTLNDLVIGHMLGTSNTTPAQGPVVNQANTAIPPVCGTLTIADGTSIVGPAFSSQAQDGPLVTNGSGCTTTLTDSSVGPGSILNGSGGGIYNSGTLNMSGDEVDGNSAPLGGGGLFNAGGATATISDSTFAFNYATAASGGSGAGIDNGGTLTLSDSTVAQNSTTYRVGAQVGDGGGIASGCSICGTGPITTLIADTITGNSANQGGGIYGGSGWATGSTIIADNTAVGYSGVPGPNCDISGNRDYGYNLTSDGFGTDCGFTGTGDIVNVDPQLGQLASNGGSGETMLPAASSPATGAIPTGVTQAGISVCPGTDERGVARPVPPATGCTIGAAEATPGVAPAITSADSTTFTTGVAGTFTVTATGLPTPQLAEVGDLPAGVTFTDNGDGTATLAGTPATGTASTYPITVYAGNKVQPNATQSFTLTVNPALVQTTTGLTSSANPANPGPVTFTATVNPPDGATTMPTGDVSFTQDGSPISSCQNVDLSMATPPTATCTVTYGPGESHQIVATYSGDPTYAGSTSSALTQTTLPGTNTTILSTKNPSPPGNVTFWAGVSPSSGTGATPTGAVAFSIDGSTYKPCASQPLGPGGGASCTVSFKAGTTHKVFASYPGSSSYAGSTSTTINQTVAGSASLNPGQSLTAGQSISTGSYKLIMQGDGNLVEYQGTKALWASGTAGHSGAGVVMQKDGDLVEYQGGKAIWASGTAGHAGAHLTLQGSDGNVVIYQGTTALWATGT